MPQKVVKSEYVFWLGALSLTVIEVILIFGVDDLLNMDYIYSKINECTWMLYEIVV